MVWRRALAEVLASGSVQRISEGLPNSQAWICVGDICVFCAQDRYYSREVSKEDILTEVCIYLLEAGGSIPGRYKRFFHYSTATILALESTQPPI
jgi:hypothetical protein